MCSIVAVCALFTMIGPAAAQTDLSATSLLPSDLGGPADWTSPQRLASTLQILLLLTVVSLAPAILLMTTSFVRIIVVLGLLRQALGTQQLPPSQVITSIALFMTVLLMAPVWQRTYKRGHSPLHERRDRHRGGVRARRRTDSAVHGAPDSSYRERG
jgi:flagellar biosynthesis protein FliP